MFLFKSNEKNIILLKEKIKREREGQSGGRRRKRKKKKRFSLVKESHNFQLIY